MARQGALAELSMRALVGGNPAPLLEMAARAVARVIEIDRVAVWELLPDERSLLLRAGHGWDADTATLKHTRIQLDDSELNSTLVRSGEPLTVTDLAADDRRTDPIIEAEAIRSWAGVLLPGRYRPLGVLSAYGLAPREFTDVEVGFLGGVANVIALAVDRHRIERRLETQLAAMQALAEARDLDEAAPRLLAAVTEALGWDLGLLWVWDGERLRCEASGLGPGSRAAEMARATVGSELLQGEGIAGRVLARGRPVWRSDIVEDASFDRREEARDAGLHSSLGIPVRYAGRILGVIELFGGSPGQPDETLVRELAAFGNQLGTFIDRTESRRALTRSQERYRKIARTLQRSLLPPTLPEIPGVDVAVRFQAAGEGNEVGGDFYDAFRLGGSSWTLSIGDVVGKGADAAATTALARHTIRAAAIVDPSPRSVLTTLNRAVRSQPSRLLTAACATLQTENGGARMVAACAGHPLPIVLGADGQVRDLECRGVMLGVGADLETVEVAVELGPSDAIVLFTDGITEARDPDRPPEDRLFGVERLRELLRGMAGRSAEEIAAGIEEAALEFAGGRLTDDLALLVLRIA